MMRTDPLTRLRIQLVFDCVHLTTCWGMACRGSLTRILRFSAS